VASSRRVEGRTRGVAFSALVCIVDGPMTEHVVLL
jgi:hypothetical protein